MEIVVILGFLFIIPFIVIYSSFAWGFVASIIYNWYIITIFTNAPALNWLQLAGIMFFINCLIRYNTTNIKQEYKDYNILWLETILNPWLTLLGAWIFKIILY